MKRYMGRDNGVWIVDEEHHARLPFQQTPVYRCGFFEWGDASPGSLQLAYAILCDALGDEQRAASMANLYKRRVIISLKKEMGWTITHESVLEHVKDMEDTLRLSGLARQHQRRELPIVKDSLGSPVMSDRGQGVVWDAEYKGDKEN